MADGVLSVSVPLPVLIRPADPVVAAETVRSLPVVTVNRAGVAPKAIVPLPIDPGAPPVDRIDAAPRVSVPPPKSTLPPRNRRALAALAPVKLAAAVTS